MAGFVTVARNIQMAGFVTVGCKIPNGVILQLHRLEEYAVPVMGGGTRTEKRAIKVDMPVTLKGPGRPIGQESTVPIIGGKWQGYGYAMNHNVDAEFWAAWCEQNKDSELLTTHMLIARPKDTEGEAREKAGLRSGLEPIDTTKPLPGTLSRRNRPGVTIETAAESAKPIPAAA